MRILTLHVDDMEDVSIDSKLKYILYIIFQLIGMSLVVFKENDTVRAFSRTQRTKGRKIGFVPTMVRRYILCQFVNILMC